MIKNHNMSNHCYADNALLHLLCSDDDVKPVHKLINCIHGMKCWMSGDKTNTCWSKKSENLFRIINLLLKHNEPVGSMVSIWTVSSVLITESTDVIKTFILSQTDFEKLVHSSISRLDFGPFAGQFISLMP